MKHKHADNMLAYAQDAQETDRPWERWQERDPDTNDPWADARYAIAFLKDVEYRRKPRTIRIGNYDVPEPLRFALNIGDEYFCPSLINGQPFAPHCSFNNGSLDMCRIKAGVAHLTKEAAELHAKALISLTEQQ